MAYDLAGTSAAHKAKWRQLPGEASRFALGLRHMHPLSQAPKLNGTTGVAA